MTPPADLDHWGVLREKDPWVACAHVDAVEWCRARASIAADEKRLEDLLHGFARYPQLFPRVTQARELEPEVVHLVLDMPFPLATRDYIVRFTRRVEGDVVVFGFAAVERPDVPPADGIVRLVHCAGDWRLAPAAAGTDVTYTWNGELSGDFPDWALPRAHLQQGIEVMGWLADAVR